LVQNDIMHRDHKPQNIFIDNKSGKPVLKIGDFGLAKYFSKSDLHDQDAYSTRCGTVVYMAPEVKEGLGYGMNADIYSVGLIFLEMLVGTKPWPNCVQKEEGKIKN